MKTNNFLTSVACSLLIINVNAQVPDWLWAQSGGGSLNDQGLSVTADATGNVYITGDFSSSPYAVFGNDTLTNISGQDIFIARYDASGNLQWLRSAGGDSVDYAFDVYCDSDGNVYIAGSSNSPSVSFESVVIPTSGSHDIIVAK